MLFNSYAFIFGFLPVCMAGFFLLSRLASRRASVAFLILASLFFYGWWNPRYLWLIMASVSFNYRLGRALTERTMKPRGKWLLAFGVGANLSVLAYYKYANFFLSNLNSLMGSHFSWLEITLPLGVSFITFQKIAYLVDSYRGEVKNKSFLDFCLFVTFFPQLIAGPIVHHRELLPQFQKRNFFRFNPKYFIEGATFFAMGLFKKVVLADGISIYATPVFEAAARAETLSCLKAWQGALSYTLQLYFDFSGYSDMAIGLGLLFAIQLPLNFNSPYQAASISDFWHRWHMSLSRFLRDYLYFPLGGNRLGAVRKYINLMATMAIGGLFGTGPAGRL